MIRNSIVFIIVLLAFQMTLQQQSLLVKQVTNCICVAFKNHHTININNELQEKCVQATKNDGTLDQNVYNNFEQPYRAAFTSVAPLLPYNCLNMTFPEQATYTEERQQIYIRPVDTQYPLVVHQYFSTKEVSLTLKMINQFSQGNGRIFKVSTGSGLHDYYGSSSKTDTYYLKGLNWIESKIDNEKLTIDVSPGYNALTLYNTLYNNQVEETDGGLSMGSVENFEQTQNMNKNYILKDEIVSENMITHEKEYGYYLFSKNNAQLSYNHYKNNSFAKLKNSRVKVEKRVNKEKKKKKKLFKK